MRRAMIKCGQVQTEVLAEGRWIEEDPLPHSSKHVVLVIPGNPGIAGFYESFLHVLNSRLSLDVPVWFVGHAGHTQPPKDLDIAMPGDERWSECYSLAAQVQHKVEFVKKYVPEDAQLHLIGHSIGAWIVLNLLKDPDIDRRVKKCYLLFPTVERLAETYNGMFFRNFVSRIVPLLILLSWIFTTMLPLFLQMSMIRIFGLFYGIPVKYTGAVQKMLQPSVVHRAIKLGREEMCIREADHETISKHIDKLWFYYGTQDKWVPKSYYRDMMLRHPNLDAQLCRRGLQHAFVLKDDVEMGRIVGEIINRECLADDSKR